MLRLLSNILLYLMAAYGALTLFVAVAASIRRRVLPENNNARLVLLVKDCEETVEGTVRNIFLGGFLKKIMVDDRLTVIDMGSTDGTRKILEKLKGEYGQLEVVEKIEDIFSKT